jgi:hypothetical protein
MTTTSRNATSDDAAKRTNMGDTFSPGDRPMPGTARKVLGTEAAPRTAATAGAPINATAPTSDSAKAQMVKLKQDAFDKAERELNDAKQLAGQA